MLDKTPLDLRASSTFLIWTIVQEEVRGRFSDQVTVVIPQGMGVAVLKVHCTLNQHQDSAGETSE